MKLDKAQNFDNFVDWVKEKDPDFMALCECNAFTEESLTALAGRYGHPYAILCKESGFPVGLTSKYPIELRNRLLEDVPLWHGAIHTRIKDINVVVLHLYPFGTYPNGQGAAGTGNTYRDRETWNRMSLTNIARSGVFAADRAISQYADTIWHVPYKQ